MANQLGARNHLHTDALPEYRERETEVRRLRLRGSGPVDPRSRKRRIIFRSIILLLGASTLVGCSNQDLNLRQQVHDGRLGEARANLLAHPITDPKNNQYFLQNLRTEIVSLADGYALRQDPRVQGMFEILRTQGINDDRTVESVVLSDRVNFWKGEPFEQAMAFYYIGLHNAINDNWGDCHAAALNSLFPLKSFGTDANGKPLTSEKIVAKMSNSSDPNAKDLRTGYVVAQTDFTLGNMLAGIASQRLAADSGAKARADEAADYFKKAYQLNPALADELNILQAGNYNTLLFVEYGTGPEKFGRGPDESIADFRPMTPSTPDRLLVSAAGFSTAYSIVCDLNQMAQDHKWKNLEDVRKAKSYLGDAMIVAGAGSAIAGSYYHNSTAGYVGLGLIVAGAVVKMSAHANTDYCEVMPQRIYVVPLTLRPGDSTVVVSIEGRPQSRLVLTGLSVPEKGKLVVRDVRMVTDEPLIHSWLVNDPYGETSQWTPIGQ